MNNKYFIEKQRENHIKWRKSHISSPDWGIQNKDRNGNPISREYIIPRRIWNENIWEGIRTDLLIYINDPVNPIQAHTGSHNLMSSWVVCANLYFAIKTTPALKVLMLDFLKIKVSEKITAVSDVELEFAFPKGSNLHPSELLGEMDGGRGSGQTSPDVAFIVKTANGEGIILTECKYTEHSFYACSARTKKDTKKRKANPDPLRCAKNAIECDYSSICHQTEWGREYWKYIRLSNHGIETLIKCPASTAGYQLFRQQSLANGIKQKSNLDIVASVVAFDERNVDLKKCLGTTGIKDFQNDWNEIFQPDAIFKTWTHQEWVEFVRTHQVNGEFDIWLKYLNNRYGY